MYKKENINMKKGEQLDAEIEEGNREYKFRLTNMTEEQLIHRITQLNWRLNEGNDEAFYLIGVEDNGNQLGLTESEMEESLANLQYMADKVGCDMLVKQLYTGERGITAEVQMTRRERHTVDLVHIHVAIAGDIDSGKSTLIGVLSSGNLDNGKGLARAQVFTYNHEVETGTTSSISYHTLHFDSHGRILNSKMIPSDFIPSNNQSINPIMQDNKNNSSHTKSFPSIILPEKTFNTPNLTIPMHSNPITASNHHRIRALSDIELADEAHRAVSLIDLAGSIKYLKTTLHGIMGRRPDYCLICISAKNGLQPMTAEHIAISCHVRVPLIIVITKIDLVSVIGLETIIHKVCRVLQNRYPVVIRNHLELVEFLMKSNDASTSNMPVTEERNEDDIGTNRVSNGSSHQKEVRRDPIQPIPIFLISNVNGVGLDLLRSYLYQLPDNVDDSSHKFTPRGTALRTPRKNCSSRYVEVRVLGSVGISEDSSVSTSMKKDPQPPSHITAVNNASSSSLFNEEWDAAHRHDLTKRSISLPNFNSSLSMSLTINDKEADSSSILRTSERIQLDSIESKDLLNISSSIDYIASDSLTAVDMSGEGSPSPSQTKPTSFEFEEAINGSKILMGYIQYGTISVGDRLLLGPTFQATFVPIVVGSIRINNVPVRKGKRGQMVSIKIKASPDFKLSPSKKLHRGKTVMNEDNQKIDANGSEKSQPSSTLLPLPPPQQLPLVGNTKQTIQHKRMHYRGLVMVSPPTEEIPLPLACWEFDCELMVLNQPSKMKLRYEPVVHIGNVSQSVKLLNMRKKKFHEDSQEEMITELSNRESAICRFRFLYYPEFINESSQMIIREDRTKGVGSVVHVIPYYTIHHPIE